VLLPLAAPVGNHAPADAATKPFQTIGALVCSIRSHHAELIAARRKPEMEILMRPMKS
jgi:hypothetical protein